MVLFLYDYKDIPVRSFLKIHFVRKSTIAQNGQLGSVFFSGFFSHCVPNAPIRRTNHQRSKLMLVSKKTVYVGADIVTMSDKAPKAEAVCIADGRIECVGSS